MSVNGTAIAMQGWGTRTGSLIPAVAGFFFTARYCFTLLFFQSEPATGSLVIIAIGALLLYAALLTDWHSSAWTEWSSIPPLRWAAVFVVLAAASILWTAAQSRTVALAYWVGMAADIAAVMILLSDPVTRKQNLDQLLKGAVWGAGLLAIVAWLLPAMPDLRLGDAVFLHPNTLGLQLGIATLIAFYLAAQVRIWRWAAILLAITLLRTLSKTSIIAFVVASGWLLLCESTLPRTTKLRIFLISATVCACFSGLLVAYLHVYNGAGSGNQAETLTGRTVLWATAIGLGIQAPWFGHGFYSFRALIPAFGDFEPWHAHNELIQIFFEFGVAGVAVAAALHWSFFRAMRRARAGLRTLSVSLLIFALLHGVTDTVPFGFSLPLWLLTALSLGGSRVPGQEETYP